MCYSAMFYGSQAEYSEYDDMVYLCLRIDNLDSRQVEVDVTETIRDDVTSRSTQR